MVQQEFGNLGEYMARMVFLRGSWLNAEDDFIAAAGPKDLMN